MAAVLEKTEIGIRPTYHNLAGIENPFSRDVLGANPHFKRLVDLCSQAVEGNIQVYENGDEPFTPTQKRIDPLTGKRLDIHYFRTDPTTGRRTHEVAADQVRDIPMHILGTDGETIIPIRMVNDRRIKIFGYCQIDNEGRTVLDDDGKTPKLIPAQQDQIRVKKTIDLASGSEVTAYDERDILREEIGYIVASHFKDLVEKPQDTEEKAAQWANAYELAPTMIGFMTDKNAHIEGVQKSHALNIVSAALQIARNPDTRVKIVSGFGASDQEPSNAYAGNALPALQMADNIQAFFAKKQAEGKRGLNNPPLVELVFALEAGIQANFKDQADEIGAGMAQKMDLVRKFASELFRDVAVVFNQDIPWSKLSPQTLAVINYYARLIGNSPSHAVQETLADLVKSGHSKGTNGSSQETAAKYSAIHPFVWGLKPDFIPTQYLQQEIPADVVIRIGPRTEAKFDAMIMAVKQGESREGFIDHVLQEAKQGNLVTEVAEQIVQSTKTYQPVEPPTLVLATGKIGEHGPTYFTYNYDDTENHLIADSIRRLNEEADNMTNPDLASVGRRKVLLARVYDLEAIAAAKNRLAVTAA